MSLVINKDVTESEGILSGPVESRDFPDWFREEQREAWEQFEALPSPTRKDQPWRFSSVNLLDLTPFKRSGEVSESDRAAILQKSENAR